MNSAYKLKRMHLNAKLVLNNQALERNVHLVFQPTCTLHSKNMKSSLMKVIGRSSYKRETSENEASNDTRKVTSCIVTSSGY